MIICYRHLQCISVSVSPCLYERAECKLKEQAQGYISVKSTENCHIVHICMYMYMYEYKQWASIGGI